MWNSIVSETNRWLRLLKHIILALKDAWPSFLDLDHCPPWQARLRITFTSFWTVGGREVKSGDINHPWFSFVSREFNLQNQKNEWLTKTTNNRIGEIARLKCVFFTATSLYIRLTVVFFAFKKNSSRLVIPAFHFHGSAYRQWFVSSLLCLLEVWAPQHSRRMPFLFLFKMIQAVAMLIGRSVRAN